MPIQILQLESTTSDGVELKSYVCLPESASHDNPAPAILVAPEWWGAAAHPQKVTERLAEAGDSLDLTLWAIIANTVPVAITVPLAKNRKALTQRQMPHPQAKPAPV